MVFDKLIFVEGTDSLPYRLLRPEKSSSEKYPLVIFLHGAGERGSDNEVHIKHISNLFLDPENRKKYPCYVLAPQCPKNEWWANFSGKGQEARLRKDPSEAMSSFISLLEKILTEEKIDKERIYITGLSMGGFGTWDLLARYPHKFAAAVPICGGGDPTTVARFKHVPIWAFHGSKDGTVVPSESRKMVLALQEVGALPGYTEYPDVEHNSWDNAYREPMLMGWLFKQKKGLSEDK